jgi:hypothetical protein
MWLDEWYGQSLTAQPAHPTHGEDGENVPELDKQDRATRKRLWRAAAAKVSVFLQTPATDPVRHVIAEKLAAVCEHSSPVFASKDRLLYRCGRLNWSRDTTDDENLKQKKQHFVESASSDPRVIQTWLEGLADTVFVSVQFLEAKRKGSDAPSRQEWTPPSFPQKRSTRTSTRTSGATSLAYQAFFHHHVHRLLCISNHFFTLTHARRT